MQECKYNIKGHCDFWKFEDGLLCGTYKDTSKVPNCFIKKEMKPEVNQSHNIQQNKPCEVSVNSSQA